MCRPALARVTGPESVGLSLWPNSRQGILNEIILFSVIRLFGDCVRFVVESSANVKQRETLKKNADLFEVSKFVRKCFIRYSMSAVEPS